jgi:hypothetical protein
MSYSAWRAAAEAMDSSAAGAAVSPLSEHSNFDASIAPALSPAGQRLLSSPSSRASGAGADDGPPPVLVRARAQ